MICGFKSMLLITMLLVQHSQVQTKSCENTMEAVKDSVLILSDDLVDANTAQEKCSLLGGSLAMTDDPQINATLTQLMNLQRVWIFYDSEDPLHYKYSYDPSEVEYWKSTKHLGHLWYLDLFTNKTNQRIEVFFCEPGPINYRPKWRVTVGKNCEVRASHWNDISVFVGARYNTSLHGWYWSDGSPANFPVSNVTTCQQGALHYGIGWEQSSMNCSGETAYYACQSQLISSVEKYQCNSSTVVVSWSGLDQFISQNSLDAQVEISITGLKLTRSAPYANQLITIENLSYSTNYNIQLTAMLTGCQSLNVTSSLRFTTFENPPPSCYPQVVPFVETFPCNASAVVVSWTGLDQFIDENNLVAEVEVNISALHEKIYVPYSNNSTIVENLENSTVYSMWITVIVTGSITTNIKSNLTVTTPGIPPPSCFPRSNPNTLSPWMIAGLVIGMLLLVLAIVGMVVMFLRPKNSKSQSSQAEISKHQASGQPPTVAVGNGVYENLAPNVSPTTNSTVTNLFDLYKKNAESGLLFANEFKKIKNQSENNERPRNLSQLPQNAVRNRYKNIYPYDHARVVLQGTGGNDYINAAYIPGYDNERKFIATQGPKKETINDFWRMVWQENSNIIVMLTGLRENGKGKCEQYWPDFGSESTFPYLKVQTQQETPIGGLVQRQFILSKNTEQRTITQLQYTTWPDHGIPVTTSNMIYLRNMIDNLHHTNSPIIVHCSAGVGRTGTYIAMDTLFHELDDKGKVDVPRTVLRMRENRIDMIQNPKQYMYLYKLLMERECLMETDKDVTELLSMNLSKINEMQEKEFETLSAWRFGEDWQENHPQLRTYKNTAVKVWDNKSQTTQQLDASYIQEHGSSQFFLAARNPAPGEEENFWKMVVEKEASLVVDLDHSIHVPVDAVLQHGDISLSVRDFNESKTHSVITGYFSTNAFPERQLIILQVKGWTEVERPPEEIDFITLIEEMQRLKAQQNCQSLLVGCSNGSQRTGTFIAVVNILERLKAQKRVDVFRTVKDLRDMRPNMVNNKELYKYCYSVVMQYLSDFDTYSNYK